MEHIAVEAQARPLNITKGERARLRRAGHIPAAIFGKGKETVLVTVEARDLAKILASEGGTNTLVDLTIDGARHLAKLTEVEIDPIKRAFLHVGLHAISATETQKSQIPVEITGEPESVHLGDAVLEHGTQHVEVRAMPEATPGHFTLDVSNMQIGDVLHASDLTLPAGVELLTPLDAALASLHTARVEVTADDLADAEAATGPAKDSSSFEEDLQNV